MARIDHRRRHRDRLSSGQLHSIPCHKSAPTICVCVFSSVSTLQFTACTFTRSALLMFHCLTFSRVPSDTLTGVGGVAPTHPHTFPRVGTCHMTPFHTPLEIVPRHPAPTGSAVAPLQGKIMLLGTFVELSWDNMNIVIDRTFSKIKKTSIKKL